MTVKRICQRNVDIADLGESAFQAADRIHQRTVGTPVVDEKRRLAGIVTLDDVLLLVCKALGLLGRLLERESPQTAAKLVSERRAGVRFSD